MSLSYRIIKSGENQRWEYLGLNRSPFFQALPNKSFGEEQKASYDKLLHEGLKKLFSLYFPTEFSNSNNHIHCDVKQVNYHEPELNPEEARANSLTWSYKITLLWDFIWSCYEIQISRKELAKAKEKKLEKAKAELAKAEKNKEKLREAEERVTEAEKELEQAEKEENIKAHIEHWVGTSFKIGTFTCQEKQLTQEWEIKEKKSNLKIVIKILDKQENSWLVQFTLSGTKEIDFCYLPKITEQGSFIINGHDKVVVFQSVRAPAVYFFTNDKEEKYGEIIPEKGLWINFSFNNKNPGTIELKFPSRKQITKSVINFLDLLKTYQVPSEVLAKLFNKEDLNIENYSEAKALENISDLPSFLFTKPNSYFKFGRLGRNKFNQKSNILRQVKGQILAEDLYDINGNLILTQGACLEKENLVVLSRALQEKKISPFTLPFSTNELYLVKIKSPNQTAKNISIVGFGTDLPEEKNYFDLADLVCAVSLYCNLHNGVGNTEQEVEKDKLENQIIRRVGDLIYSNFENRIGAFFLDINNRYLAYLSQLKKTDPSRIPSLKIFESKLREFFNNSELVQLQNQNNPLAEISYTQKLSVLGLGGFSSANTTFAARNINSSYYGRYDLVETPEGQKVGLIHNLTIGAKINDYGQILVPYYLVQGGVVTSQIVYLVSEEEWDKYIIHCNLQISEDNKILDEKILARYRNSFTWIEKEKANYIEASFYQLNSVTSATIPFFHHNDATRMLMATNMQRQAVPLLQSQEPWVASGVEANLARHSPLIIRAEQSGQVEFVDSRQIIIKESPKKKKTYNLKQLVVSNKNVLNFSSPLVKWGDEVVAGQIIANGNYVLNNELALGQNLRVAYLCWEGYNFEDAIVLSERLVKEDILTSFFVKKYTISRYNTKHGPETFTASLPHLKSTLLPHLDENGIVKIGQKVKEHDVLVGKITPQPHLRGDSEEEILIAKILGEKYHKFIDSSLYLPAGESGVVYEVKKKEFPKKTGKKGKKEIETIEVYVAQERKISLGDKLTTRFGNKGVVAKIVPEVDMPFDEEGGKIDIIFNPLSVPTRMNIGQLLETIFASIAKKTGHKLLVRPFNTPSLTTIRDIIQEVGLKNFGTQKLFDGRTGLPFSKDIYTGYIYTIKLNHMATDKFHARNTGSYSLIYQQPLKGRGQGGGQRIGEMEAWALEAHGAAHNLMEMMSVKSDDIQKRQFAQNSLIFDNRQINLQSSQSESFNILLQYLRGIGFDLKATNYHDKEIDFYQYFNKNPNK